MRAHRAGVVAALVTLSGSLVVAGSASAPAGAQTATKSFPAVQCSAKVGSQTLTQSQDVSVSITAPDQVVTGQPFTVTFPGGTNQLPSSSNGLTITSYRDLTLSYQMHASTFTNGTIQNPGTATINGDPTPNTASIGPSDTFTIGQPGPFPPGTLVTPDVSVGATAGAIGSSVTINALRLTTTARINNSFDAQVTCNIPQDTVITIPVVSATPPPVVDAGPDVSGALGSPVALHGSVSPSSGTSVAWSAPGTPCRFSTPASVDTSVTCSQPGTFTATLTADDGLNPPVHDTVKIVITQPANLVVDAGDPVSGTVGHPIAVSGLVSDPGHTPTSSWTIDSPACTYAAPAAVSTTVTCTALGTFTATLTATDGSGSPVSDTTTVTVHPDLAPTVSAGPNVSGDTRAPIHLVGVADDPESDPVVAHWTASNPGCVFSNADAVVTDITCSTEGDYTATLTAGDAFHPATSDDTNVKVRDVRFPFDYVVDATTHLKKLNQDVTVPTGTFTGVVDLTTGALSGDISLPPAQMTLNLLGFGLVTANMQIVESQPVTGTLDPSTFAINATAIFDIRIISAYPSATPTLNVVGDSCRTSQPVSVTMAGTANLTGASTFSSTYTIPNLETCGLATTALNLVVPGPGNTFTAVVQPPPAAPSVSSDPASVTVADGATYSFSASAGGYPAPAQRWQKSTDGGATFADIPGATGATYGGTATLADSGTQFRSVFTNASGSATSAAAVLTVAVPPAAPTIGVATAGRGSASVKFTPAADDGGSPVIDATASCTSSTGGVAGSGTASASPITVSGLTPGASYTCTVRTRNVIGQSAPSAASNAIVPTAVPSVTQQPQDTTVPAGTQYSFTAAATGTPTPTVQWQVSADGGASYTNIAGATATTLTATAGLDDSGELFRAVFTNSEGSATTAAATLVVTGVAPQITEQPASATVESGTTYTFSAAASGIPAPTVQWQVSTDGGASFHDVGGGTSATLTGTANEGLSGARYRAVFTNSEGSATTSPATLTVVPAFAFSIGSASIVEGDSGGNRTVSLPVVLSRPASAATTVRYATVNGNATAGSDYLAEVGTLTFKAGATVMFATIQVKPDTTAEPDETFQVALSNPTAGTGLRPGTSTGTVTILNDDPGSGLRADVSSVAIVEGNGGKPNVAHVLVTLSAKATSPVTVTLHVAPGTATSGVDYKPLADKVLTFNAGQFQKSVSIQVLEDLVGGEGNETVQLSLSAPSAGLTIGHGSGILTIVDDD
ncbi:MAG: Calx-beta domain-containing protein [Acidimicrobiia bacterium]